MKLLIISVVSLGLPQHPSPMPVAGRGESTGMTPPPASGLASISRYISSLFVDFRMVRYNNQRLSSLHKIKFLELSVDLVSLKKKILL